MGTKWERAFRFLANDVLQPYLHRWRLNLVTGQVKEERLSETVSEFGMLNGAHGGRKHRYVYSALSKPAWFLFNGMVRHDTLTGQEQFYRFEEGVFGSDSSRRPARRQHRRGRRLRHHADLGHQRGRVVRRGVRRQRHRQRPGLQAQAPRAHLQRHPLHVGARESLRDWDVVDEAQTAIGL